MAHLKKKENELIYLIYNRYLYFEFVIELWNFEKN